MLEAITTHKPVMLLCLEMQYMSQAARSMKHEGSSIQNNFSPKKIIHKSIMMF